jgi:hypothetical protein
MNPNTGARQWCRAPTPKPAGALVDRQELTNGGRAHRAGPAP